MALSEAGVDHVLIPLCFCCVNHDQVVIMLNRCFTHDKSIDVCIKARPTSAPLPFKGQVTEQTTVKWSITATRALCFTDHVIKRNRCTGDENVLNSVFSQLGSAPGEWRVQGLDHADTC